MAVSTSIAFERLSRALDEARELDRAAAVCVLHDAAATIEPKSPLMRWFLHEVAALLGTVDDGA